MASTADTLTAAQTPTRVFYSLGRMLGVDDFRADQDYHRGRLARALLLLCGTGTVSGLKVRVPQQWAPNEAYPPWSFVIDAHGDVQVNAGTAGTSGTTVPAWSAAAGATTSDGTVTWTNEGPIIAHGWLASTPFTYPSAIVDANGNLQILTVTSGITTGSTLPAWNVTPGFTTADGSTPAAWTCAGRAALEVLVTPGIAVDRIGRVIEVPRALCIPLQDWLAAQTASDLNAALHGSAVIVDVFASFAGCPRGATPSFATQDDYDATDAFSANRLLDSCAMQLVLRTDATPQLPEDPWRAAGAMPPNPAVTAQTLQQAMLNAGGPGVETPFGSGAIPIEYPPKFDPTSVFLARLSIPATPVSGNAPATNLSAIGVDNFSRLFLYPTSLVARWTGLGSGAES
ncbi:MAG TPA: hypothetical protein VHT53_08685 [Candidatus Elarobacter sp.]|jgi:hypothetical protein|nr:hypothetical protein [Candidatus Elarobacter sp.]